MVEKYCPNCKKTLDVKEFITEAKPNRLYAKCNYCRNKINSQRHIKKNKCEVCGINANFNYEGETFGICCKEHSKIGMIDVKHKRCEFDGCNTQPSYNLKGETNARFCKQHAEPGMIDIKSKRCEYEECEIRPCFNYKGETVRRFCKQHALSNMVDITKKTCEYENCEIRPCFNYTNQTIPKFCKKHSLPNMVDLTKKTCEHEGCDTIPCFNYSGQTTPKFCSKHALSNMIDIKNKKCEYEGCTIFPIYNFEGQKSGRFCKEHAEEGMIDIKHTNCRHAGCTSRPNFNFESETIGIYCSDHKLPNMVDVTHNKCEHENCNTRSTYGFCGQKISMCSNHKLDNMYLKPTRFCGGNDEEDCKTIAIYGVKEPSHCEEHKLEDEICLIGQTCKRCGRNDEILNKNGLCLNFCEPDEKYKVIRLQKKKEMLVLKYLDENFKKLNIKVISDDKIVDSRCNRKRPDRIYDCGTHYVIVEIDENQHTRNCKDGELTRMYYVQAACGINCIFLRFNPDDFKINNQVQKVNMNERLKILVKWIDYASTCSPTNDYSKVRYKYLFYNEYNEKDISFIELNEEEFI